MQFSTNSDEAIRALIRACPTLAGQYRQAVLQLRDRLRALQEFEFSREEHNARIALKTAERQVILDRLVGMDAGPEATILEQQAKLIEIGIWRESARMQDTAELIEDAQREIRACRSEIERINTEAGLDLGELTSPQFQALMADEFKLKRVRFIASRMMGLPFDAAEALLEIPDHQRDEYLYMINHVLKASGVQFSLVEGREKGLANESR